MINQVLREMVKNAAEDIDIEFNESQVEGIKAELQKSYKINLSENTRITWQLMDAIAGEISAWQFENEGNF